MKQSTLRNGVIIILGVFLAFTILITPIEARLMNENLNWMYVLNIKEYFIFAFSIVMGILIGRKSKSIRKN